MRTRCVSEVNAILKQYVDIQRFDYFLLYVHGDEGSFDCFVEGTLLLKGDKCPEKVQDRRR